jgi:hypothetical protein
MLLPLTERTLDPGVQLEEVEAIRTVIVHSEEHPGHVHQPLQAVVVFLAMVGAYDSMLILTEPKPRAPAIWRWNISRHSYVEKAAPAHLDI